MVVELHSYMGVFTGKYVKPVQGVDFQTFKKGDTVIVINADEFDAWLHEILNIRDEEENTLHQ
jgi:hypothetical protein